MDDILPRPDGSDNVSNPATLHDVASAAGVSPMTVSRVLNGVAGASAATRIRVSAVAERLGYRPNALAKGLKARVSNTIALLVPDIANPFFPEIIRGAEDQARTEGNTLLLCNVGEDQAREAELLGMLEGKRVDGVIICSARLPDEALYALIRRHGAAVLVNREAPHALAGTVRVNYHAGAAKAAAHLAGRGRRKVGIIAGPAAYRSSMARIEGATEALAAAGLVPAGIWHATPDVDGGRTAVEGDRAAFAALDALVCYNDLVAVGAMTGLKALRRRIPEDVAVVGFDDIQLASLMSPALTSVRVDKYAIGRAAMRMLLDRRAGVGIQHGIVVEPELVVRESG
ncbi:MAG: LacI family DNA-binding transcriptional regulator [Beijerinckiaceae bacterium]